MTENATSPSVTVLVDTWNHDRFIEKALDSVLTQDFDMSRVEIIVIDDGSTDSTPEKIAAYGERVRYVRKENGGQATAFNVGIPLAKGAIIAMLDGDDWWREDKLKKIVSCFNLRPDVGFIGHAILETDCAGKDRHVGPPAQIEFRLDSAAGADLFMKYRCCMGTSRMAGRADVFRRLLPVPDDLIVEADEHFFTLAPAMTTVVILPEPLCFYRLHGGNLYQFTSYDTRRLRLKSKVHTCLALTIPKKLEEMKVPTDARDVVLDAVFTDARRLRLAAFGGLPGSALPVEWKILRQQQREGGSMASPIKWMMLALALVLPSGLFYRVRAMWSRLQAAS